MKFFAYDIIHNGSNCADKAANSTTCQATNTPITTNPVYHTLSVTAEIIAAIAAIAAVIMIIISGLTLVTSQGNAEAAKNSRNRIIYAVVGLIIIALAASIASYVTSHLQ